MTLLTSRSLRLNPAWMLRSVQMAALFAALTGRFGLVIMDTPPALAVTDATVLSATGAGGAPTPVGQMGVLGTTTEGS